MLRTAATWIKRLDHADTARTSVHVYQVKYGEAKQIARVLTDMFIGGSSSSLLDSPDNQIAPGSGIRHRVERRSSVAQRQFIIDDERRLWPPQHDGNSNAVRTWLAGTRRASYGSPGKWDGHAR